MARGNLTEKTTPEATEHAGAYLREEHVRRGNKCKSSELNQALPVSEQPGSQCSWNEEGMGCSLPLKKVGLGDWYQMALVDQVKWELGTDHWMTVVTEQLSDGSAVSLSGFKWKRRKGSGGWQIKTTHQAFLLVVDGWQGRDCVCKMRNYNVFLCRWEVGSVGMIPAAGLALGQGMESSASVGRVSGSQQPSWWGHWGGRRVGRAGKGRGTGQAWWWWHIESSFPPCKQVLFPVFEWNP